MSELQHQASNHGVEQIRREDVQGREFWFARELAPLPDCHVWRNFSAVIDKVRLACGNSGHPVADHFDAVVKMVETGSSAQRPIEDVRLSCYACYQIVQNGNPAKPVIAAGQTTINASGLAHVSGMKCS